MTGTTVHDTTTDQGQHVVRILDVLPDVLDDLQRVHLQLGMLEFQMAAVNGMGSETSKRLFEAMGEVQSVMERLSDLGRT